MRKYLTAALAAVVAASMSMTAFAAGSTSPGAGSLSPNTPGVVEDGGNSNGSSSSSSGSSSSSRSRSRSRSKSSGSSSSGTGSRASVVTPQAQANAALQKAYNPTQAVVTADGQSVSAKVSVTVQTEEMKAAFQSVAAIFGVSVTDTFAYTAGGIDPGSYVTTAFAPGSIPAGSALLVVDALGNLTVVVPVVFPDGTVAAVLPAVCQVAVVAVPAVPAA